MAVKLYGAYYAPNANRALLVLHEKEVEFELVSVSTFTGEHKKPEYMALHPFGKVPFLQDGGVHLFGKIWTSRSDFQEGNGVRVDDGVLMCAESRAIARFVADKYEGQGTPRLHGGTLEERAQVEQWLEVESGTCSPVLRQLFQQLIIRPGVLKQPTDQSAVAAAEEQLAIILDVYEAHLAHHQYLAGDFVSIADLAHLSFGHPYFNLLERKQLLSARPHVAAWWAALSARPAWQTVAALAFPVYEPFLRAQAGLPSAA
jgi:glutathione S-transferase